MNKDGVIAGFQLIVEEIAKVQSEIAGQVQRACERGDFAEVREISHAGESLGAFKDRIISLSMECESGIDFDVRKRFHRSENVRPVAARKSGIRRRRRPHSCLRVRMPDGRNIEESRAADTFVKAIEGFGIQRVHALGLRENGVLLVDTRDNGSSGLHHVKEYFVCTHSNTARKRDVLIRIAESLGIDAKVEVIPKN